MTSAIPHHGRLQPSVAVMIHIPARCLENNNGKHNTRSPPGDSPTCHKRPNVSDGAAVEDSLGAAAYRSLYVALTGTSTVLAGRGLKNATIPVLAAAFLAIAKIQPPAPSFLSGAGGCIREVLDGDGVMQNKIVSTTTMQSLRSLDQPALSALLSFSTESLLARWSGSHANEVPLLLETGIDAVRAITWPIAGAWDTMGHVYVIMNEDEMAEWSNAGTAGGSGKQRHPKIYVGLAGNTAVRKRYRKAGDVKNGTGYHSRTVR